MKVRLWIPFISLAVLSLILATAATAQEDRLWVGQNVNMVSGTTWPDGDPFLQRQNEPSVAVSTRGTMRLVGFTNDYRSVDLPGLPVGKETGDAWLGVFKSLDGGMTWRSTLLPGYPQDVGSPSPIHGYEAGADPVVRAGTHGLFFLTGIVFDRGDPARSAVFMTRYMDLGNRESGDPIEYIDTGIVKANNAGEPFIDKPWMAVDIPRTGAQIVQIEVFQDGSPVYQNVQCGNVYLAWAEIFGIAPNQRSTIMFSRSSDCGTSWAEPMPLSDPDTMNQGVSIAISPDTGDVWLAWRQFETDPTYLVCASGGGYWKTHPEEWPLEEIFMGGMTYTKAEALDILNRPKDGDSTYILAKQLIPAKLNAADYLLVGELQDLIDDADAWLVANTLGSKPTGTVKAEGLALKDELEAFNNGEWATEGCTTSVISPGTGNAIVSVRSTDGGFSFAPPAEVSTLSPFEQATTPYSFRTNAYPTITVDNAQPYNRAYIAWTTRGLAIPRDDDVEGDARVVVSTSTDGMTWTIPDPVDQPEVPGHQIVPSITFAGGKVVVVYYDLRRDMSGVFDRFIADFPVMFPYYRHTVDVQAAQADPGDYPEFTVYDVAPGRPSGQVSRYLFLADYGGWPSPPEYTDTPEYIQMQFNPPNLTIYLDGTRPFFGDYVDIGASPSFLPNPDGSWRYNTEPADGAAFHAVWTDNRDIEAPHDGDWSNYVVPGEGGQSIFDSNQTVPACDQIPDGEGQTKIRDQNTYTARLTSGLYVGSPGGSRPIGALQRAFVVTVRNDSEEVKTFRLTIDAPVDVEASFEQFSTIYALDLEIAPYSSATRTIFVTSSIEDDSRTVTVNVAEVGGDGLTGSVLLNGDPSSPPPADAGLLTAETYTPAMMNRTLDNPAMMNPAMMNLAMMNLAMMNPAMMNPAMMNLAMMNPAMMNLAMMNLAMMNPAMMNLAMMNPAMMNPAMMNPAMMNPAMMNPAMMNPAMMNPAMMNPAMMNTPLDEVTWELKNDGTATAGYSFNLLGDNAPDPAFGEFIYQLFIYREYKTPAADGCELVEAIQQQELVNVLNPEILDRNDPDQIPDLFDPDNTNTALSNPTFYLDPGDSAYATFLIVDLDPLGGEDFGAEDVWAAVVAQAVNTDDAANGETEPDYDTDFLMITTTSLPDSTAGVPYAVTLTSTDGLGLQTWTLIPGPSDPPGTLTLSAGGLLSGTVTAGGTYPITVQVNDPYEIDETTLTLQVNEASVAAPSAPAATPIGGLVEAPVTVTVEDGNGNPLPGYEVTLQLVHPSSGGTAHNNVATTAGDGIATFDSLWFDRTGVGYELVAELALDEGVVMAAVPSTPFDVDPLVVITTADDGPGSLRQAIENAERNVGWQDDISFEIVGPGPHTIALASPLPSIIDSVIIDAETQPLYSGLPLVYLDGIGAGPDARGFEIRADATEVRGLAVVNFTSTGIQVENGSGVRIENNYVGTDGTASLGNIGAGIGANSCTGLIVSGNLVSGNDGLGIFLGEGITGAVVSDNKVGTNATGNAGVANTTGGMSIFYASTSGNTISNNLISGNMLDGLYLWETHDNTIVGNMIGTDVTGSFIVPNAWNGLYVGASQGNTIGGALPADRNVISGNDNHGIELWNASANVMSGNFIGTTSSGLIAMGNGSTGIEIWGDSWGNRIGGPGPGDGNVVSANNGSGINIENADNNTIQGNSIGTDVSGSAALGNTNGGIAVIISSGNIIRDNLICGNSGSGIRVDHANNNTIWGNWIGTNSSLVGTLGNSYVGIFINTSSSTEIGGSLPGAGNTIAFNGSHGIEVGNSSNTRIERNLISANLGVGINLQYHSDGVIIGNRIGTDWAGIAAMGNSLEGVRIGGGSSFNTVGGPNPEDGNLISANSVGLVISGFGTLNFVQGNFIGTDVSGSVALGNTYGGITVYSWAGYTIRGNLISGNTGSNGIYLSGASSTVVVGNTIGTNQTMTAPLPNHNGIELADGARHNIIGVIGEGNVVSGNANRGIVAFAIAGAHDNIIQGNWVGTDPTMTLALGNEFGGIMMSGTTGTVIGGHTAGAGNVTMYNGVPGSWPGIGLWDTTSVTVVGNLASANTGDGISIGGNSNLTLVEDNRVGTTDDGLSALGNGYDGISLHGTGVTNNTITGNLISGNVRNGISIDGETLVSGPFGNTVIDNIIGLAADGVTPIPNQTGVFVGHGAFNNIIGGALAGNPNTIAGNLGAGVAVGINVLDTTATGNAIISNSIYSNGGLGIDLSSDGITANDGGDVDGGPNDLLNFPVLASAVFDGVSTTTVTGSVHSLPGISLWIGFFTSTTCDSSGYGEGRTSLGTVNLVTDGGGNAGFIIPLTTGPGGHITATSSMPTGPGGHTSEFSACVPVTP